MTEIECLIIMPFKAAFDPVFAAVRKAAEKAVPDVSIRCEWLKDIRAAGRITDDILGGIRRAGLCIADVTGNNPNVMWETGYAMALGKPTLLLAQSLTKLPFDLTLHRVLKYHGDRLDELASDLGEAIRQTLARYTLKPAVSPPRTHESPRSVIAVTGSMAADPLRLQKRIQKLLAPYLPLEPLWYAGSNGIADEVAIRHLLENDQKIIAVGYHKYDYSESVKGWIEGGKIGFIDASLEEVPRGLQGPSERDVLFVAKADLVALFWDGKSSGTRELVDFFRDNAKSLLLGFV